MISRLRCRLFGHDLSSFIERTAITYCRRCGATGNVLSRVARQQAVPK